MSYAVCHMQKIKSHALKGMQFHHQRERESKTNFDIDKSKSELNYDLVNPQPIDFNKRVKEIIQENKTDQRKVRKDAVLVSEFLLSSDSDFFKEMPPGVMKIYFEESYNFFADRYGAKNIAYAMVHHDEKTPHMHLGVVPIRDGSLQAKNIFNRKELIWLQEEYPKHMRSIGFEIERGSENSTAVHIPTHQLKLQKLQEEVQLDTQKLQTVKEEVQKGINKFNAVKKVVNDLEEGIKGVDEIKFKKIPLRKEEIMVRVEDFENLKNDSKKYVAAKADLQQKNVELKLLKQKVAKKDDQLLNLTNQNRDLKKELEKTVENHKGWLKRFRGFLEKFNMLDKYNAFVKELAKSQPQQEVQVKSKERER